MHVVRQKGRARPRAIIKSTRVAVEIGRTWLTLTHRAAKIEARLVDRVVVGRGEYELFVV
jgi:hypothetical protein